MITDGIISWEVDVSSEQLVAIFAVTRGWTGKLSVEPTLRKQAVKIKPGENNLVLDFSLPRFFFSPFRLCFSFAFFPSTPLFLPSYFPSFLLLVEKFIKKKCYLFLAVLSSLLRRLISSFRELRLLPSCSARASHCSGLLWSSGSGVLGLQQSQHAGSVVAAPRL